MNGISVSYYQDQIARYEHQMHLKVQTVSYQYVKDHPIRFAKLFDNFFFKAFGSAN